ncbi:MULTISPECIES: histidine phosphatase family protein [unclassified Streptomyces]|uniref:histidine phosphatase family protein n=1 Tax=unclassified Streptomyces TaxID=2593676 RepID=UPI0005ED090D|nr:MULTISPECIES: histidine phosphatase family protein [unclassified Streptomyces]APU44100.1 histidine phosphatase family protein [Streptomyces sp. TN58]KJK52643.1 phosphoglycerate mutase [Streptomyces sp. NRRL F-4428]
MTRTAARYLYLTRHGEASPDESELTDAGRRQAALLGQRLRGVPLTAIHHGPLARAEQTARLVEDQLDGVPRHRTEAAGDYVPYLPAREELPPEAADAWAGFLGGFTAEEREQGPGLAAAALAEFTGPVAGDAPRHELVVTHNFLAGWLLRDALASPRWRWLGVNHANAALTVIRYAPDRPPAVLLFNDTGHLPAELRWTGFPRELHV